MRLPLVSSASDLHPPPLARNLLIAEAFAKAFSRAASVLSGEQGNVWIACVSR